MNEDYFDYLDLKIIEVYEKDSDDTFIHKNYKEVITVKYKNQKNKIEISNILSLTKKHKAQK